MQLVLLVHQEHQQLGERHHEQAVPVGRGTRHHLGGHGVRINARAPKSRIAGHRRPLREGVGVEFEPRVPGKNNADVAGMGRELVAPALGQRRIAVTTRLS